MSSEMKRLPPSGKDILEVSGSGTDGPEMVETFPIREDDIIRSGKENIFLACPLMVGTTARSRARTAVSLRIITGLFAHRRYGGGFCVLWNAEFEHRVLAVSLDI